MPKDRVGVRSETPRPFLKWAGGKGQLLEDLDQVFPPDFSRYFEPFLGGGAVFFHLSRIGFGGQSILSDTNPELITAYQVVRNSVEALIDELQSGFYVSTKEVFYEIRGWDREPSWRHVDPVRRTARMIYLNRTCYNGLYRVNQKGQFNVPFGRYKNPTICDEENLRAVSKALKNAKILCADFAEALQDAGPGDFVYLDPPYQPMSDTAYFTEYTSGGFGVDEQKRLADVFLDLHKRGCLVLESNSDVPLIRKLYENDAFITETVQARRAISCDPTGRGTVGELLIRNYSDTVQARLPD
ncbi:MAG: DNA adenine methylase [Candidatus Thorarchaeota archaeon]|nr:MAG: DNA adenine methylase [Candidatus Thorarchaeota archaeon]